ncbi:hypothetical protein AN944_01110 [Shewanella sp. P1-14-1]|uniref:HNH endonuclease n=1 Tax=Shewanella sp. P1-14-1 TaxID=1723761 RepID=UPI0006D68224|nr:HNH endonuclease [Shewanella sp. P1-14-1]KPZ72332.1 hypothetical protein AN944_01110 [Shewanella sp. P1-14-1]
MIHKILSDLKNDRSALLKNVTCVYCGTPITKQNDSKEHVISRKFVPKSSFDNKWNLIVQACKECNGVKSDLENDISAITLELYNRFEKNAPEFAIADAKRKSKNCFSRQTKKLIKDSEIVGKVTFPYTDGKTIIHHYKAPARLDEVRCFELAKYHLMAFFYFITFDEKTMKGGFWQNGFHPAFQVNFQDWGNKEQIGFMNEVRHWETRWQGITANGFFKSIIKKHPTEKCWSWALEWNKSYRLTGFFGCRKTAESIVAKIPELEWRTVTDVVGKKYLLRDEVPLSDEDDILFKLQNV